jgi:hypothetical protein
VSSAVEPHFCPATFSAEARDHRRILKARTKPMQDILWIGVIIGLLAATLAYVRLLDKA